MKYLKNGMIDSEAYAVETEGIHLCSDFQQVGKSGGARWMTRMTGDKSITYHKQRVLF